MVYLHVSFTLEAQDVSRFERVFEQRFWPVLREHGFEAVGIWKTVVGTAGEVTEIWRFRDFADYERRWKALMGDPRVAEIFEATGPMVRGETFKLMESVPFLEKGSRARRPPRQD